MLALAGGAAMMGRGKASVANTAASEDANINTNAPILGTDHITKKAVVEPAAVTTGDSVYLSKMGGAGDKATQLANQKKRANYAQKMRFSGNLVPPSMRGGAPHAEGYQKFVAPNRQWPGGYIGRKGGGIAKRGKGAAYKSGGRVKSMGIAKRGGGAAKR